jgi:hypothetical protein
MPTLRRILKYTPAVVMGLLVVTWMATAAISGCRVWVTNATCLLMFGMDDGSVWYSIESSSYDEQFYWETGWHYAPFNFPDGLLGIFRFSSDGETFMFASVPFLVLATALLPFASGSFIHFRFRLWHYLAYTALVAVELAYFLRWQE